MGPIINQLQRKPIHKHGSHITCNASNHVTTQTCQPGSIFSYPVISIHVSPRC